MMNCKRGTIHVLSPKYCADIHGDTLISIKTDEPIGPLTVLCVSLINGTLCDTVAAELIPDHDGTASFVFPAENHPHGPITIRICGGEGPTRDVCHLQLYNTSGNRDIEHAEHTPLPEDIRKLGLKLVYLDDFDSDDLSISRDDPKSRYYSHKPGGGDFSQMRFSDFESDVNPFSHKDTFIRIRADLEKGSSGLISCVKEDGSGFSACAPCYFECRMIGPNAIGSWPAFWLINNHVHRGLHVPVDELDTIEAYGLEDLDHQNQVGYYCTSHRWNQGKHETTDPDPDCFYDMTNNGNHLNWDMCFHTYGTLITEDETVYYCDGEPIFRHPTQPISKKDPFFFMLNLAVGGNGWPVDISRYGKIDLYADFIRVYARE
ncbi:MAG: family 16 glycosylhydrolase [Clostridia bacterium]|nr:family 16 glycosylhydrolase [Clostridia bacterium]